MRVTLNSACHVVAKILKFSKFVSKVLRLVTTYIALEEVYTI